MILVQIDGLLTNVSHILTGNRDQALRLKDQIMDTTASVGSRPALFAELAFKYSKCPSGKGSHGNLGVFSPGQMAFGVPSVVIQRFEYLAFHGKLGEVLGPFRSKAGDRDFGWQILYVHDRHQDKKLEEVDGKGTIVNTIVPEQDMNVHGRS
jgi:parvulin-like peptidyl-prolyl isomerase